jgi:hypothetical protein
MTMPEAAAAAPLDDQMLVADVVDTLRHGLDSPVDPATAATDPALATQLRDAYRGLGLEISDTVLREGIAAMSTGRFAYAPPRGVRALVARLYVSRDRWGPPALGLVLALLIGLAGYAFAYEPYRQAQAAAAQRELHEILPARLDALYQQVYNETKVQSAATKAAELRDRGKQAATAGDRAGAERAIAELGTLREQLGEAYTLRVVDRDGVKPGFWTFPPNNSEATNYYLVVEAVDASGRVLDLPVTNTQTGVTETVDHWGLRVPQAVYEAVMADRQDDGIIEHNFVGLKQDGFLDVDYAVPVIGGAVTRW